MADGYYKITVEAISTTQIQANLGLIRPNPTPFDTETTVTASGILGDIRQAIIDTGNFTSSNVKQIGNGIYVTRPSGTFNVTSPTSDLLKVMSSEVKNVDDLPDQCKHGYVVKVANSEADEDDYFVKFYGNNDRDGDGVWEECAKPGRNIEFDKGTMPIQLVRQANGTFTVSQATWENADVGDTLTNPNPSFVGKTVNQLVFFRNRLVFLSDENVIMSRPGEFFNFWSKTATTFTPQDVIDLSCSSEYPAIVYDGIQVNAGLLLFTKNQQFMLTTDSDILSPETAKLNAVASYNFNEKTNPVSLGTTVAFIDNANKYTRFFEMSNVLRQGEPDVVDQSKVISRLLDKDISLVSESRENSAVFFSKKGTDEIYCFRYFNSGDKRLLQAWCTWTLAGNIQYHCMLDDALFVITRNNNKDQMVKYSLKLDDNGHSVTDTRDTADTSDDYIYRVHLDHSSSVTAASGTYNSATLKTTIPKPNGYENTKQLVAYETDSGNDLGRYSMVTVNGSNLEIVGDWSNNTFVIGYLYEMDVQIPTIYVTRAEGDKYRADAKSSLIVHRIKFSFGPLGVYSTTLQRVGKPDYTETKELALAGVVSASRLPIVNEVIETVPCYERNTNLTVNVKSEHPAPATLYSLAWEGDFTNRFYRRV
ncbi:tail tubular protein B [uncultured phage MedDCM-OCT-S05-C532]|nr:tail tubular protein B [uncultured phage MedDCM-OCT-S05-C532]